MSQDEQMVDERVIGAKRLGIQPWGQPYVACWARVGNPLDRQITTQIMNVIRYRVATHFNDESHRAGSVWNLVVDQAKESSDGSSQA